MKFDAGRLATVLAVSAAALAGCDQRQGCGSIAPDGRRVNCAGGHGGFFYFGGGRGFGRGAGVGDSAAGVARGGFGGTASGHGGGGAGE